MRGAALGLALATVLGQGFTVFGWEPFRRENEPVREGNEHLAAGRLEAAVDAYDRAARGLPTEPRVHLNRGIGLLRSGRHDEARDALALATEPSAPSDVRAAAHYDLGLVHLEQAEEAATAEDHEEAQRLFREAADAFRASLRLAPGNADAGWNLELALRRLREEQEQQEQQEQEEQEQDDQPEQQDDPQEQDEQGQQDSEPQDEPQPQPSAPDDASAEPPPTPNERVLDALRDREESLGRARARTRAARERRRVERDW